MRNELKQNKQKMKMISVLVPIEDYDRIQQIEVKMRFTSMQQVIRHILYNPITLWKLDKQSKINNYDEQLCSMRTVENAQIYYENEARDFITACEEYGEAKNEVEKFQVALERFKFQANKCETAWKKYADENNNSKNEKIIIEN